MKMRVSVLVLIMAMCPFVGRAQICTDFDDDMNIIEYDCGESLTKIRAERAKNRAKIEAEKAAAEARAKAEAKAAEERAAAEAKALREAEKVAKAKAEAEAKAVREKAAAEEKARKDAEKAAKAKAEAEARAAQAKIEAEAKARKAAEKAAKEKAAAEARAAKAKADAARKEAARIEYEKHKRACKPYGYMLGNCTDTQYFVAGGLAMLNMTENITPTGISAELGMRLAPVKKNWYFTFSLIGEMFDDSYQESLIANDPYVNAAPTQYGIKGYDISAQSAYLTAGVGYKFWRIFDVYGKIAPGMSNLKVTGGFNNISQQKSVFDFATILGLNVRVYKWLNLYGETQLSLNHANMYMNKEWTDIHVEEPDYGYSNTISVPIPHAQLNTNNMVVLRGGVKIVF